MSKHARARGSCIFCGTLGVLTREDVTPKWIGRFINEHFAGDGPWETREVSFGGDRPYREHRTAAGSASVYKPPVVCGPCNNGWMSRLEIAVRPLMAPLMLGEVMSLSAADQRLLATWATKVALVHEFVHVDGETTASAADRRRFHQLQLPLPTVRIAVAKFVGTIGANVLSRSVLNPYDLDDPASVPSPHANVTTLLYGHLAIRVVFVRSDPTFDTRFHLAEGESTAEIWPSTEFVEFPTGAPIDDHGLTVFMKMQLPSTGPGALTHYGTPPI